MTSSPPNCWNLAQMFALLIEKEVGPHLFAGRLESVAARLLIDRERARMACHPGTWWDLLAVFAVHQQQPAPGFEARLSTLAGRPLVQNCDFNTSTGQPKDDRRLLLDEATALDLRYRLETASFSISGHEDEPFSQRPSPPFTTATLQQAASSTLGFALSRTMRIAQQLYEGVDLGGKDGRVGLITYMRTDSTHLSKESVEAARTLINGEYGLDYLPAKPNVYGKAKRTQEAHDAIRHSDVARTPDSVRSALTAQQFRLYDLIWRRFAACQMTPARWDSTTILIAADTPQGEALFRTSGRRLVFDGFLRVAGVSENGEVVLPDIQAGSRVGLGRSR